VRKITEKSIEQVITAISAYLHFLQRAVPGDVIGGSELNNKIFGYAERNVESAFEFAQRLVLVRDAQELTKLQADFVQAQMQAMTEQAKDLSETATKALTERKKPDKGWPVILIEATTFQVQSTFMST
jgi:phasin family protein